jgi:hypothetical protein
VVNVLRTAPAALVATLVLSVPAMAASPGSGNSGNAPGQARAQENCVRTVDRQTAKGVAAGGGPKAGIPAPTNCDHFFQSEGFIGGGQP